MPDFHERYWGLRDSGQPSEYSHGADLVPSGHECAEPDDGGMYAAKCPPVNTDDKGKQRYAAPGRQVRA